MVPAVDTIPQGRDRAAKLLFDHVTVVRDLLRGFVPSGLVGRLDLDTLRPLPDEYLSSRLDDRRGDHRWLVQRRDGSSLVALIEFQSTVHYRMVARMMTHTGLLYEKLARAAAWPDRRLPDVLPIVVYTGEKPWTAAQSLSETVGLTAPLATYVAGERYLLLDLRTLAEDDLPERNRMTVMIRLEASGSMAELAQVLDDAYDWLGKDEPELWLSYLTWVELVLLPLRFPQQDARRVQEQKERTRMLAERAKRWTEEWLRQGFERGRIEGVERGREDERMLLCRQAARRFDDRTGAELAKRLASLNDPAQLAEVGDWIVDCATGAELLARFER